jgi:hypothetical protein
LTFQQQDNYNEPNNRLVDNLAEKDKSKQDKRVQFETEDIKRRLDMLDHRLDDIDTMVSAVIERVMVQPISLNLSCPHCGRNIEISMIGNKKPTV